jgi:hypothetical protein
MTGPLDLDPARLELAVDGPADRCGDRRARLRLLPGKELRLGWHTVKALEKQYMGEPLRCAGTPGPTVLGLDEVSIEKGHT